MDRVEFDKYLKDRFEDQVGWYDRKAQEVKSRYGAFQTLVIILAALTTVIAALGTFNTTFGLVSSWITVFISGLVTVFTGLLSTFKYKETWLNYRGTFDALMREKSYYLAQVGGYRNADDRQGLFVQHVEAILARESSEWQSIQCLKDESDKPKSGNQ